MERRRDHLNKNAFSRIAHGTISDEFLRDLRTTVADVLKIDGDAMVVAPIHSGVSSQNYEIRVDDCSYMLRVDLYRDIFDVTLDEAFAAACRDVGVNTPPPVFWGGHGGNFPVSIRPFVPGSVLDQLPGPNVDVYADCGHQLALIHSAKTTLAREWFYELPIANLRREPRMKWSQDQLARQAYRLFHDSAHQVDDSAWNRGLIHSDFRAGNIVINSDGIPVILDWEKATVGPICFDLGLALFHIMTEEREQHAAARLEAFISGYGRSSSLASDIADDLQSITSYAASTFYLVDYDICK